MSRAEVEAKPAALNTSNYEIYGAMRESGCPLCRVDLRSEERLLTGFFRDGILNLDARRLFVAAGGFCQRHAWRLHHLSQVEGSGAAIADVYGQLADRDLGRLDQLAATHSGRAARRQLAEGLGRSLECQICLSLHHSRKGHAAFLCALLDDEPGRSAYAGSEGICSVHLELVVRESLQRHPSGDQARWLLADWRRRLARLRVQLSEYDRKRSYTAADEAKGAEQDSWTEVISRYVGGAPS